MHVSVGALHCLAVTDNGQVFAWGDNDHGQQGNGSTNVNRKPLLVQGLDGYHITRVACGSSHSVAWATTDITSTATHEPVPFNCEKDALGSSLLGICTPLLSRLVCLVVAGCSNLLSITQDSSTKRTISPKTALFVPRRRATGHR